MTAALGAANKAARNNDPDLMPVSHAGRARLDGGMSASPGSPGTASPITMRSRRGCRDAGVPLDFGHEKKPTQDEAFIKPA